MRDLGTLPGGDHSGVGAINERGQLIGGSFGAHVVGHAWVCEKGTMTDLGLLNPKSWWSSAAAVNERDQIVGNSTTARGKGRAVPWTLRRGTQSGRRQGELSFVRE